MTRQSPEMKYPMAATFRDSIPTDFPAERRVQTKAGELL
jgi:hypothetical protein